MDELIVGTYEGFVLGYAYTSPTEEEIKLKQTFATQSHTGSVRCISLSKKFLASGGTDDKIIIIDLKIRKEHTVLMHHDGTVNALSFTHGGTHLVSGSDDGSLVVTRVGNWLIEKKWKKAHGGQPVHAVAVHSSDKLILSIGGDKTLRTWNLIKGRPAFTINLSSKGVNMASELVFAPEADRFAMISQQTVDVWTLSKAGIEKRITCNSKPTVVQWMSNEKMFVGLENGNILVLNVTDTQAVTCNAHKQRVKCIHYSDNKLFTASSSGEIKYWSVKDEKLITEKSTVSAGCRITCMALSQQGSLIKTNDTDEDEQNDTDNEHLNISKTSSDVSNEEDQKPSAVKAGIGSFVSVSFDDNGNDEPPKKKIKKKRNKKHLKNKE